MKTVCSAQHLLELVKENMSTLFQWELSFVLPVHIHEQPVCVRLYSRFLTLPLLLPPALICCPGEALLNHGRLMLRNFQYSRDHVTTPM